MQTNDQTRKSLFSTTGSRIVPYGGAFAHYVAYRGAKMTFFSPAEHKTRLLLSQKETLLGQKDTLLKQKDTPLSQEDTPFKQRDMLSGQKGIPSPQPDTLFWQKDILLRLCNTLLKQNHIC